MHARTLARARAHTHTHLFARRDIASAYTIIAPLEIPVR